MPTKKTGTTPANQQKGKKVCTCCHHRPARPGPVLMSAGKVVAGGAVGVALGTLLGFFVLAPNIDGGPDRVVGDSRDELAAATSERDTASAENDAADGIIAADGKFVVLV